MRTLNSGGAFALALLVSMGVARHGHAGNVYLNKSTAVHSLCMGTLHITSESPTVQWSGTLNVRSVDTLDPPPPPGLPPLCNSVCGDGVVNAFEECDPGADVAECSSNCRFLHFPEYEGDSYLDDWETMDECRETEPPVPDTVGGRDVTFLAFGDPQYGNNEVLDDPNNPDPSGPGITKNRRDANRRNIAALNRVEELVWPPGFEGAGLPVSDVRGVIIAGDLTQEGDACTTDYRTPGATCGYIADQPMRDFWFSDWLLDQSHLFPEYQQFRDEYGLCGDKKLRYPAFEGAGNHDYWRDVDEEWEHPVHKYIAYRNNFRPGLDRVDPLGKGHYSWTWDDVHFVQLNLAARDTTYLNEGERDMKPYSALTFLKHDLERHVTQGQPVVLISHYPWIDAHQYTSADRWELLKVIKHHNVIALIHGHTHGSSFDMWDPCEETDPESPDDCATQLGLEEPPRPISVIDSGNPMYGNGGNRVHATSSSNQRYGHYSVIRITDDFLEVSSASWQATGNVCDDATRASCQSHPDCQWDSNAQRCHPTGELCMPGVTTSPCKPNETGCESDGGWAAKVSLATGQPVMECLRPLFQYCNSPYTCIPY